MKAVGQKSLFASLACLGAVGLTAQVLFMRELLVVFQGDELTVGLTLACWLVGVGLGALLARVPLRFGTGERAPRHGLAGALLFVAVALPVQLAAIRGLRLLLGVAAGEDPSLAAVAVSAFALLLPTTLPIGLAFPLACEWRRRAVATAALEGEAVSRVYGVESAGSMFAGLLLTFVLLPAMRPVRLVGAAMAVALAGAALAAVRPRVRGLAGAASVLLALAVLWPGAWRGLDAAADRLRWRAFGVLAAQPAMDAARTELVATADSVHQNLAIAASEAQYTLYANGRVASVFPDPHGDEIATHFVMAERPDARRVLLLGGNPVADVPELLKYPIRELVCVELDPAVGEIVRQAMPGEYAAAMSDPRVRRVTGDAPRFLRGVRERFDLIVLRAPDPTTAFANRFHTVEFCRRVAAALAPGGVFATAVRSSERLQSEAADLGASVYRTLKAVFPVVLVTAESRNRFFAGFAESGLTFDRETLAARDRASGAKARYFVPDYFLGADEIEPGKVAFTKRRFEESAAPLNTELRPAAYFHNLVLWARMSDSAAAAPLKSLQRLNLRGLVLGILALGVGAALAAGVRRAWPARGRREFAGSRAGAAALFAAVVGSTGACGIALEIVLVHVFQGLYGYVYARMGLIVAAFMFGLVTGAPTGRRLAGGPTGRRLVSLAALELWLVALATAIPWAASAAAAAGVAPAADRWIEAGVYALVWAAGWAVGAEFPLANRFLCQAGLAPARAAGLAVGADSLGAAVGGLATGVVLIPVLGIGGVCAVLAALKVAGLLLLLGGGAVLPREASRGHRSTA